MARYEDWMHRGRRRGSVGYDRAFRRRTIADDRRGLFFEAHRRADRFGSDSGRPRRYDDFTRGERGGYGRGFDAGPVWDGGPGIGYHAYWRHGSAYGPD